MIQAVKKPIPITVVQVPAEGDLPLNVHKREDGSLFVKNELHQSEINCAVGDYINVTNPGDTYPISKDVFESTYEPVVPEAAVEDHVVKVPAFTLVHVGGLPFRTIVETRLEGSAENLAVGLATIAESASIQRSADERSEASDEVGGDELERFIREHAGVPLRIIVEPRTNLVRISRIDQTHTLEGAVHGNRFQPQR